MKNFPILKYLKNYFSLGILLLTLSTCNITGSLDSNKRFGGFLSFFVTYSSLFNDALLELSGTLVGEDGSTPLSNGTLIINYQLLNVTSKAQMDSQVKTDSLGNFKMNLNIGKFKITVFTSTGENLGYFTINISSASETPKILEKNGKFGVINLVVRPISQSCSSDTSLCGFITGSSSSFGKFFVFGSYNDSSNKTTYPVVYETTDGLNFTKNKITLGTCVPSPSSNQSSINTECRITAVANDGTRYFIMGVKSTCISNSCTSSTIYAGTGTSLESLSVNEVTGLITNNDPNQNYVYANGVFHFISFSNGTSINSSTNGSSFTSFSVPTTGSSTLQNTCQNLYIGENGLPFCGLKYFYNGTWTATTTSVTNSVPASYINFNLRASYNKGLYQILTFDSSTLTSSSFNGNGSLIPNSEFSTDSTPRFSEVGSSTLFFSTNNYIFGFLANITAGTSTSPPTLNSIKIVRSLNSGASYSSSSITLPVKITYPMGFGSTNSHLFLAGYTRDSSNVTKSYLFRSTDGITWSTVILP
jgi:hypothetical protein